MAAIGIEVTSYDLSIYPCQGTADPQHLAYMTLQGTPLPGTPRLYQFVIYFYPDGTKGLGVPTLNTQSVTLNMYYSQLAGLIDLLNLALLKNGPACQASYNDAPQVVIGIAAAGTPRPPKKRRNRG